MRTYPKPCACCREVINSRKDHRNHIIRHQSEINSLVKDLCHDSDEDCEPCNDVIIPVSLSAPLAQEPETKTATRRTRSKDFPCPEDSCRWAFTQLIDLERHRFTHYEWNRPCSDCYETFPLASAYVLHKCKAAHKPNRAQIRSRQRHVEQTLRVNILAKRKTQIRQAITPPPAISPQHFQEILEPIDTSEAYQDVRVEGSSNNTSMQALSFTLWEEQYRS